MSSDPKTVRDAASWGAQALALTRDAASVLNSAYGLPGDYGRYASPKPLPNLASERTAIAAANVARQRVAVAVRVLAHQVATSRSIPWAVQGVLVAVSAAARSPADALRAFRVLGSAPGASAVAVLCRRLAVVALAQSSSRYAPTSHDDAQATLASVTDALDAEIQAAGDAGDDASYGALRRLRVAVVADLTARGASLAPLATFTFGEPLPALVLAQLIYQDAPRADELVRRVDPVHPLFMPTEIRVLAS